MIDYTKETKYLNTRYEEILEIPKGHDIRSVNNGHTILTAWINTSKKVVACADCENQEETLKLINNIVNAKMLLEELSSAKKLFEDIKNGKAMTLGEFLREL